MLVIQILFVIITSGLTGFLFLHIFKSLFALLSGVALGLIISVAIAFLEPHFKKVRFKAVVGGTIGFISGLVIANLFTHSLFFLSSDAPLYNPFIPLLVNAIFGYVGFSLGYRKVDEFELGKLVNIIKGQVEKNDNLKLLDTSVIIDGRISDICETGFLEGQMIIPQFVLKELQLIADSSDSLKRNRGRRGLDILQKIQKNPTLNVRITEEDFPKIGDVDTKLVALCKKNGGKILTNDFNLNKVAELQGVSVLNINQLANAVKPVVLPGEVMTVYVLKEGKEYNQGIAYLDDGTMVVIDNARRSIGKTIDVSVTSVLQTTAGRMIFTKVKEDAEVPVYE